MKMGAVPVFCIGLALFLIFVGFGAREYIPNMEDAKNRQAAAEKFEAEAAKLGKAKKRLQDAKDIVQAKADEWQVIVASRTPPSSLPLGIDMNRHAWQLVVDSQKYRNAVQTAVNTQVRHGGVRVMNGPIVPPPDQDATRIVAGYYNYPAIPFPVVIFDLGVITVQGTYSQIKQNVTAWSSMPNYLAVASGLTLQGTGEILTGTYSVSMVGYIRGDKIFPVVPQAGAPAGGAAGGGPGAGGGGGGRGGGGGGRGD